jgi:DNA invertase Pin-like site-specific DNA recombinase
VRAATQLREREVDQLVARYRKIRNMREVAREFRMSRTTVAKHLADRGIDASRGMKPADAKKAVEL